MHERATVQGILSRFLCADKLDSQRRRVCGHLLACRTEALGGLRWRCDACGSEQPHYHGCRDRHCPQCQARATRRWSARQQEQLLPVNYHHLVFTLPHRLNGWVQCHPEVIYRHLFQAAWLTLKAFGQDRKRLGGQMGMTAVLHTWGQNLSQHVHLHCLVPGGALSETGQWQAAKGNYLFPVKALSHHFRGAMVSLLRASAEAGELYRITGPGEIDAVLDELMREPWVVYSKACLRHSGAVVTYLARYSHRIAITNARILSVDEESVVLRYKDYRDGARNKTLRLSGEEFVRRYLLHILPKGLMRIRHYGFLANRCRKARLQQICGILGQDESREESREETGSGRGEADEPVYPCNKCRQGSLRRIGEILPTRSVTMLPFR